MDLFVMNRYWSEDQTEKPEQTNEEKLLEKLKAKVASKKKSHKDVGSEPKSKKVKLESKKDETVNSVGKKIKAEPKSTEKNEAEKNQAKTEVKVDSKGPEIQDSQSKKKRKKSKKKTSDGGPMIGDGFQVLGELIDKNKSKVNRVLPNWLANPDFVSVDLSDQQMPVQDMQGLDDHLRGLLKTNEVSYFFPVQRLVIPWLLKSERFRFYRPNDVCVSAPTGSGKTLSFVLPIVQALRGRVVPRVRALVILPVQELAAQVFKVFQNYCEGSGLKVRLISGQKSFVHEQIELVRKGSVGTFHSMADILIATPGRIVDHLQKTEGFDLTSLRYLVIDEADRVMEDVQNDWLTHVENAVFSPDSGRTPPGQLNVQTSNRPDNIPLQKLLFSATLSKDPEILQQLNLYEPKMFTTSVNPDSILAKNFSSNPEFTTPLELKEMFVKCDDPQLKPLLLQHLLVSKKMKKVLIFTKSGDSSHSLAVLLKQFGLSVDELSSKAQEKRAKVLNHFRSGSLDFVVCTDALARGIDIGTIDYVISYDLPKFVTTYIHRVGRTARAGRTGTAITIVEKSEDKKFKTLMKDSGKSSSIIEEICSTKKLDKQSYDKAREEAAKILLEEKSENSEKKTAAFGKNKKKFHNQRK